jgi:hypothetical protein
VEMAGIEPASERFNRQISTSVVDHLILPQADGPTYLKAASHLDPKALFHAANSVTAWHSGIVSPAPRPVGVRCGQTQLRLEAVALAFAYAAKGIAA